MSAYETRSATNKAWRCPKCRAQLFTSVDAPDDSPVWPFCSALVPYVYGGQCQCGTRMQREPENDSIADGWRPSDAQRINSQLATIGPLVTHEEAKMIYEQLLEDRNYESETYGDGPVVGLMTEQPKHPFGCDCNLCEHFLADKS